MLIEDFTLKAEIYEYSPRARSTGNLRIFTTGRNEDDSSSDPIKVVSFSVNYGINTMPGANIGIEFNPKNSVRYLDIDSEGITKTRKSLVGQGIRVTLVSQNKLLFEGIITGIQIQKSAGTLLYSLRASGGPVAFFNMTLGSPGWFPYSQTDEYPTLENITNRIEDKSEKFKSPKAYIEGVINTFTEIAKVYDSKKQSDTSNNPRVKENLNKFAEELRNDITNFLEPSILSQFYGVAGDTVSSEDLREAVRDFSVEYISRLSSSSFFDFIVGYCNQLGVNVVPFINKTLMIPDMLFTDSIKSNVLFPSVIQDMNITSDPFYYPDQIIVSLRENF